MFAFAMRWAVRLGRWPRRLAALLCLLLAAATALTEPKPAPVAAPHDVGLHSGEVAVPLSVDAGAGARLVRSGDRVGVLYTPQPGDPGTPALVADQLRVLSVSAPDDGLSGSPAQTVLLATDRAGALRLARIAGGSLRLLLDRLA